MQALTSFSPWDSSAPGGGNAAGNAVTYLLDTDHISFLQRRFAPEHAVLVARMAKRPLADFAFSVVSLHEQAIGTHTYVARARTTAEPARGERPAKP